MKGFQIALIALFLFIGNHKVLSQKLPERELYKQIMEKDSVLFHEGFNNCNIEVLYKITDNDFEFYHDQSGFNFGQEKFIDGIRNNICALSYRPVRKIVQGSVEVYPLKSNGEIYGVIQNGVHEFYAKEEGKKLYLTSTAKFTHLWIKKENNWILKRVLSYDHKTPNENTSSKDQELFDDSKQINLWLKENKVPILALAKIEDFKLSNINVYGNLTDGSKAPHNTIFNVASLTKPIVSMLALKLVDNGDWDLDEPLYKYWIDPDVQNDPNSKLLTMRHILSHQSGFSNWRWKDGSGKLKFNFEPGTAYNYSGEGFEYLRKALENKFKKPLNELADSLLFQPLKMYDTKFFWDDRIDESRFAKWYDAEGKQSYPTYKNNEPNAADDLLTTIEDYGRFVEYVINGLEISESLFAQMITQQNNKKDQFKMGLGWELFPNLKGEEYALMHTGGDKGVNTMVVLLPKTGEGIIIFTNSDNGKNVFFKAIEGNLSLGKQITGSDK